ncbi:MAG: tetratricopeptide repeat protein [Bacteroidales bacterium]|nr:tetratricopeptide repeat protein [Bacteroidales bacterium]
MTSIYEKNPKEVNNLKIIISSLQVKGCTENELYYSSVKTYHETSPSAESAANIGQMAFGKGNYNEAIDYFNQATQLETDNALKANYHYGLANSYYKIGKKQEARENALKAVALKENWGDPYILIGQLYAESSGECTGLTLPKSIYWVAVDKFIKAKSVDPLVEELANRLILTYSKYFPSKRRCFLFKIFQKETPIQLTVG